MKGIHLVQHDLVGVRFAVNVFIGSAILWYVLRYVADSDPIWAIASMIAASEPVVKEAARLFRARIINVLVGWAPSAFSSWSSADRQVRSLPLALAVFGARLCTYRDPACRRCGVS